MASNRLARALIGAATIAVVAAMMLLTTACSTGQAQDPTPVQTWWITPAPAGQATTAAASPTPVAATDRIDGHGRRAHNHGAGQHIQAGDAEHERRRRHDHARQQGRRCHPQPARVPGRGCDGCQRRPDRPQSWARAGDARSQPGDRPLLLSLRRPPDDDEGHADGELIKWAR